jgi:hypothetical protein
MYRSLSTAAASAALLIGAPSAMAKPIDGHFVSSDRPVLTQGTVTAHTADTPRSPLTRYQRKLRTARREYRVSYRNATRRLGVHALGRNIARYGVQHKRGTRAAHVSELRESTARLQAMIPAAAPAAITPTGGAGSVGGSGSAPNAHLASIAQCESGGDPTAVSPDGTYRGKYQFDQGTWSSVGGTGDPAAAPESVQDEMAARLYAQRGGSPWGCA